MQMTTRNLVQEVTAMMLKGKTTGHGIKMFDAVEGVLDAYNKAIAKHPDETWPKDVVHMTAIMMEEAGEAVQAANDVAHANASLEPLRLELVQTAAMCIRCLVNLEDRA